MTIQEKIAYSNKVPSKSIHLWKEGVFWIAYEQGAYQVWKLKKYKVTKKFVKVVGMDVVSVGFPHLKALLADTMPPLDEPDISHFVMPIDMPFIEEDFLQWKAEIPLKTLKTASVVGTLRATSLQEQIQNFDISNATPMECMMFLAAIKKEITQEKK